MVIKIDMDGVIRDIFTPMLEIYLRIYKEKLTMEDIFDYDVDKVFTKVREVDNMSAAKFFFNGFSARRLFLYSKPYEGVRESLKRLKEAGHKIVIVTWQFNTENKMHTLQFLEDNDIPYDDICFTKDKWMVQGDILIDDNPEFILDERDMTDKFLVDMPYNKDCNFTGMRVPNLNTAVDYILR